MAARGARQSKTARAGRGLLPAALVLVLVGACTTGAPAPAASPGDGMAAPAAPSATAALDPGAGQAEVASTAVMPWAWMSRVDLEALEAGAAPAARSPAPLVPATIPKAGASIPPGAWRVPVLTYHLVTDTPAPIYGPDMTVSPARLEAHLKALRQAGWRSITAADAADALAAGHRLGPRSIIVTFDDGYEDAWQNALPILVRNGFTATFYVVPGLFDTPNYLTTAHARGLALAGMEVANHTWDHPDLSSLPYATALGRIVQASDAIESITGVRPTTFAYPFGRFNQSAVNAVSAARLQMAFTTVGDCLEYPGNRLVVPRIRVNPWTTVSDLTAALARCTG